MALSWYMPVKLSLNNVPVGIQKTNVLPLNQTRLVLPTAVNV